MVENLCANKSLKKTLYFDTFKKKLFKKDFFSFSFSKIQTPVAKEAPYGQLWKSRMVAVEGPYGSCGGPVCLVYCPVGRNKSHLVSLHQVRLAPVQCENYARLFPGQKSSSYFLMNDFHANFHFQPLNSFNELFTKVTVEQPWLHLVQVC